MLGHTIEEQSREQQLATTRRTPVPAPEEAADHPAIGAAIGHWAARTPDHRFEYGLALLLDGIRARAVR
ncbi:TetR/AcrR family transcriptional regulator C-terminal domain-containing protein [Kitasatospora sp. NPDC048540]|uniref:TetR/AcrR family transcriptional regulator C-terminal domain-containing protein n=1 Tax=unclassified Kitasatospora TaxID=2633591 RepID=UPI00053985AE|nr:TetR/AcrR family transcriptional regulator C-terminal domain-containing protein [Kitasatospora sp. MBT63]